MGVRFEAFATWEAVLAHVAAGGRIWYHAPLDTAPRPVLVSRVFKNGKLRILPGTDEADPFNADAGHLERIKKMVRESA